jgi:hypothetical protein
MGYFTKICQEYSSLVEVGQNLKGILPDDLRKFLTTSVAVPQLLSVVIGSSR